MIFFLIIISFINIYLFNTIWTSIFIFLIFLFINFFGLNLSIILLIFIGLIFLLVWVLLSLGFTFLAASLGLIYIGAILVLFLYLLILINKEEKSKQFININLVSLFAVSFLFIQSKFKQSTFFLYSSNINEVLSPSKFYLQNIAEIDIFASILVKYNLSSFFLVAFYLILSSILLLKLLKSVF